MANSRSRTQQQAAAEFERTLKRSRQLATKRLRELSNDKSFLVETARLQQQLQAFERQRIAIKGTMANVASVGAHSARRLDALLRSVNDPQVQSFLRHYSKYVTRFHVVLRETRNGFVPEARYPYGSTFQFKVRNGQLVPTDISYEDWVYEDLAHKFPVVSGYAMQKLITKSQASIVEIEEDSGDSTLSQLERFVYDPNRLTFILHKSVQKYLFCLIGENVQSTMWRSAATAVTGYQKDLYGRQKAGRPKDLKRLKQGIDLRQQPGMLKKKAFDLKPVPTTGKELQSRQAYLSRIGRTLKGSNHKTS